MPVQILIAVTRISHNTHGPIPPLVAKSRVGTAGGDVRYQRFDDSFWAPRVFGGESQECLSPVRLILRCQVRLKATLRKQICAHRGHPYFRQHQQKL